MNEEKTQGSAEVASPQSEKQVKCLPAEMNGATIDTIIEIVARDTKQSVTWRVIDGVPTVFTTGDVYAVLRGLRLRLPREYRRS